MLLYNQTRNMLQKKGENTFTFTHKTENNNKEKNIWKPHDWYVERVFGWKRQKVFSK